MRVSYGSMMPERAPVGTGHVAAPDRAYGCLRTSGEEIFQLCEQFGPTLGMAVARLLVEKEGRRCITGQRNGI